jgi:hypothetical protein
MTPHHEVDYILHDCFFALGQELGPSMRLDASCATWWRRHYRACFLTALTELGNSWARDRVRVMAVGRHLGACARKEANGASVITLEAARRASATVERGCRMNAEREADGRRIARPA